MPSTGTEDADDSGVMTNTNAAQPAASSASVHNAPVKPPGQSSAPPPPPWTKEEDALLVDMMVKRFLINQRGYRLAADFQNRVRRYEPSLPQRDQDDIWDRMYFLQRYEPCYDTKPSKSATSREVDGPKSLPCVQQPKPSGAGEAVVHGESGSNEGEGGGDARVQGEGSAGLSEQEEQQASGSTVREPQPEGASQPDEASKEAQPTQQSPAKEGEQNSQDAGHQEGEAADEEPTAAAEQAKQPDASQTIEPNKKKSRKHKRKREKVLPTLIIERIPQRVRLTGEQADGTAVRYMPNGEVRIEYGPA